MRAKKTFGGVFVLFFFYKIDYVYLKNSSEILFLFCDKSSEPETHTNSP